MIKFSSFLLLLAPSPLCLAQWDSVTVEECPGGLSSAEECNAYCGGGDENSGFYNFQNDDNNVLTYVSCSCGGTESTTPESVTKRCERQIEVVVEECTKVTNQETCTTWCGEDQYGNYVYQLGDNQAITYYSCSCSESAEMPITRKCEANPEFVVETCTNINVGGSNPCKDYCGEDLEDQFTYTVDEDQRALSEYSCTCKNTLNALVKQCDGTYELVVEDCAANDVAVDDSDSCSDWCEKFEQEDEDTTDSQYTYTVNPDSHTCDCISLYNFATHSCESTGPNSSEYPATSSAAVGVESSTMAWFALSSVIALEIYLA